MKPATFKIVRVLHRWSGVFFAPLILLFSLSGLLQLIDFSDYNLPEWFFTSYEALEDAHQDQRFRRGTALNTVAVVLTGVMAVALILTTLLGVVMAWTMYPKRRKVLLAVLAAGVVLPLLTMVI